MAFYDLQYKFKQMVITDCAYRGNKKFIADNFFPYSIQVKGNFVNKFFHMFSVLNCGNNII